MAKDSTQQTITYPWNHGAFFVFRTIMHLIAAGHFWYAIWYDFVHVHFPTDFPGIGSNFGGKFKFLTFLDVIIQAIYFTISLLNDFIGTNDVQPKRPNSLRRLKDYIFASYAYPLAMNVGITFWILMAIDRELILPKAIDEFFPTWLNHIMHTNIVVFILLDMFTTFRHYPNWKSGLKGLCLFMAGYLIWIHIIKYFSGFWVYPILNVLDLPQRIAFYVANLLLVTALYFSGEYLNRYVWSVELKQLKGGKKSK